MNPRECFGYVLKQEYGRTRTGETVKLAREECNVLWKMQCRQSKQNAECVCNFFKTRKQFEADRVKAKKIYNERRLRGKKHETGL